MKILIAVIIMAVVIYPAIGEIYNSPVDIRYGFKTIYNDTGTIDVSYQNNTLTINQGDTVVWINDDSSDSKLTIINIQNLWDNESGILPWSYKRFSYTFNDSGIYDIYIKEYDRFSQKIIVGNGGNDEVKNDNKIEETKTEKIDNISIKADKEITPDIDRSENKTKNSNPEEKSYTLLLIIALLSLIYFIYRKVE